MPILDMVMLGFLLVVAVVGLGWFIYELRKDDDR
ncbi:MAG: Unknown protein [uncultured Sulfurovum sp.]|uniref:Uncharacterized protein n=1 Tax=uncultured Sulfurovum sp. TaxID=269237 RepID=A0A6S6SBV4_9BACT|nr:MAG: Unknown protein [uncultured Sulfurovum sp.]